MSEQDTIVSDAGTPLSATPPENPAPTAPTVDRLPPAIVAALAGVATTAQQAGRFLGFAGNNFLAVSDLLDGPGAITDEQLALHFDRATIADFRAAQAFYGAIRQQVETVDPSTGVPVAVSLMRLARNVGTHRA